jgi:hypothetical protein
MPSSNPFSDEETGADLRSDGRGGAGCVASGFPGHHLAGAHNAAQIPISRRLATWYLPEAPENSVKRDLRSSTPSPWGKCSVARGRSERMRNFPHIVASSRDIVGPGGAAASG